MFSERAKNEGSTQPLSAGFPFGINHSIDLSGHHHLLPRLNPANHRWLRSVLPSDPSQKVPSAITIWLKTRYSPRLRDAKLDPYLAVRRQALELQRSCRSSKLVDGSTSLSVAIWVRSCRVSRSFNEPNLRELINFHRSANRNRRYRLGVVSKTLTHKSVKATSPLMLVDTKGRNFVPKPDLTG